MRALLRAHAGSVSGRARIEALRPLEQPAEVRRAQRTTTEGVRLLEKVGRQPYHDLPDLADSPAASRVEGLHLEAGALLDVASFIEGGLEIARRVAPIEAVPTLAGLAATVADTSELAAEIRRAVLPSRELADDASPRLAEIRRSLARLKAQLHSVMDSYLRGKDADRLLQDKIVTTRNDRYVLLLKAEHRGQLPGIVHGGSGSGASLFVEPMPAVELNNDIVEQADEERREVLRILRELTARVGARAAELERMAEVLGELDAVQARALLSREMAAVEPEIDDGGHEPQAARAAGFTPDARAGELEGARRSAPSLELKDARHPLLMGPLVERLGLPRRTSREPVPVTLRVGFGSPVLVISGPNTGGKTVALKTVGLLAMMAQSGLHVPAGPGSRLPVFRRIFADIGDDQSIAENLSTFSAHLKAIVEMTGDLAPPALVLLDEVGAGTDPTEGGGLGVAIVDHFRERGAMVVATTHHGLMKAYAQSTPGVACASFGYHPATYEPTYRLSLGVPGRSLALEMAERLGLPAAVVADARSRLDEKQAQAEALLKRLEQDEARLRAEAERLLAEREQVEAARGALRAEQEGLERRKRLELDAFARELRKRGEEASRRAADAIHQAVQRVEAARETARRSVASEAAKARSAAIGAIREAQEEAVRATGVAPEPERPAAPVVTGSRVRVRELGVIGEVLALHGSEAELAVGGKRLRVPASELIALGAGPPRLAPANLSAPLRVQPTREARAEINVVGLTVDEALPRVDKLLDDAALAERQQVRVIHGFGQGRLRQAVAGLLEGHPHVASFRLAEAKDGGGGVTIVELKE